MPRHDDLERIEAGLDAALKALAPFTSGEIATEFKSGNDPITAADLAVDEALAELLPREGEGWLSEETVDDHTRLSRNRVWIVDPIDGTREFVQGTPEWCVSIGLLEAGRPVAGGIVNPATGERIIGSVETGLRYTGDRPTVGARCLAEAVVLASRSEIRRGEWDRFADEGFTIVPMGSVAFKLALVAAGRADATWTLVPKHEWDVAAGAALLAAAGGWCVRPDGRPVLWNQRNPLLDGFVATAPAIASETARLLGMG
jgi:myo-inositol-1(or 4)-monophosphatase